jgi:DNA-directed RNA polymerase subunit RPC12/RpoP
MGEIILGVLFLSPIVLFLIYDALELRRCDRCGKSGLRKSRPWTSQDVPEWCESSRKAGDTKVEYKCKYCGYKEWIPDKNYPVG